MATNRSEHLERLSARLHRDGNPATTSHPDYAAHHPAESGLHDVAHRPAVEPQSSTRSLLLTVPEACAELRVSRAQLYILVNKQHAIEMVHIGKLARIPRASLEAYVELLRHQASEREFAPEPELESLMGQKF